MAAPGGEDDGVELPDIHSPEHRRALRERGRPHGDHIGPDDEDPMPHVPHPEANVAVAEILADFREWKRFGSRAPETPAAKAVWATTPVVIGMVVGVLSIVGSAATTLQGYTQLGDRMQSFGERILAMENRVLTVENTQRERGKELAAQNAENSLQNERQRAFSVAIEQERQARIEAEADARRTDADQRAIVNDMLKAIGELRTDVKVLIDRAQRHGTRDGPEHDAQAIPEPRPR